MCVSSSTRGSTCSSRVSTVVAGPGSMITPSPISYAAMTRSWPRCIVSMSRVIPVSTLARSVGIVVAQPGRQERVHDAPAAPRRAVVHEVPLREETIHRRLGRPALAQAEARLGLPARERHRPVRHHLQHLALETRGGLPENVDLAASLAPRQLV